ncbi:DUF2062 domain-containing protein [Aureispira anguillae]|uniref:DUF2062 domain-containing protein n=1 Tax=Aureispira anguillae TaxID=2864201 RepID=A0A915YLY0_9BACT|nr:DUF2062 domain-containing protein [Aureispira anguillae]BDS15644.1 DUF2062 domain-containing protein [Aureispira anguillae]
MIAQNTTKQNCAEQLKELNCCVIIPTYNNAQMLEQVIQDVEEYTRLQLGKKHTISHLLVVNDGSTDTTAQILERYPSIMQLSYTPNEGKGIAMRRAFEYAIEQGYNYAITLDSDGQHYAKDLPTFVEALKEHPNAIVIGSRNMGQENVPTKSSFGNKFSSFWLWVETGIKLEDTQSGYRLYPIKAMQNFSFVTGRYEFEVEVLVRAAWEEIELLCVPIDVYYPPAEERITHFRPFKDFFRISVLNTFLCVMAFFWFRPRLFFRSLKKKDLRQVIHEKIFQADISIEKKALSIAYGIFWGIFPLWGFQLAIGIPTAIFFRLNVPIFFLAANISIPPMIPIILYASFWMGALVFGENRGDLRLSQMDNLSVISTNFYQYTVGAVVLAIVAAIIIGLSSYFLLKVRRKIAL